MKNWRQNIPSSTATYVLLIVTLLVAQALKLHMHIEHEHAPLTDTEIHVVDIHASSYLHETIHGSHDHNNSQEHHDAIDIDSTINSLLKKTQLLNPFVFFILTLFIILCVPRLRTVYRWHEEKKHRAFSYCFPPQRAPPIA